MRVLITNAEGYLLSEISRLIYSPGYTRADLPKSEHEVLCDISKLIENRLRYEGVDVIAKRYDTQKEACFPFDKARNSAGCDAAILLALNSSQNSNAQFSTAMVHQEQSEGAKNLFESTMYCLGRYVTLDNKPVSARYPNSLKRIPFLETCRRNKVPAIAILPFYYTDKSITTENLGGLIESVAKAISEAILSMSSLGDRE